MSMSNSEARKRAVENAVQAMKAEVWDEGLNAAIDAHGDRCHNAYMVPPNPYRSEAGR